jgi:S-adenosylmethionine decarboxylase
MKQHKIGEHYLVEYLECDSESLEECDVIRPLVLSAAEEGNATILSSKFHQFSPVGVTGILLLAESHISIHTWPEHRLAAVDIFTCGDSMSPEKTISILREGLGAREVQLRHIERVQGPIHYECRRHESTESVRHELHREQ